jgi:hypothetical protein
VRNPTILSYLILSDFKPSIATNGAKLACRDRAGGEQGCQRGTHTNGTV